MLNYKVKGLVARAKIMLRVHQKVTQIFSAHLPNWPKDLGYFEKKNHASIVELVSKELNHLAAILHVYAGGLNFMK